MPVDALERKPMKKNRVLIWTIVASGFIAAAFTLSACQPTPSEEVVVNKRETDLYSESELTDVGAYDAPTTWSEQIENGDALTILMQPL